jgi:hypothetical protein
VGRLRLFPLALVATVACGGQTAGAARDAGNSVEDAGADAADGGALSDGSIADGTLRDSSGEGGAVVDSAVQDAHVPADSFVEVPDDTGVPDAWLPAVGTPGCEDLPCVLCADGYYHCHAQVYSPCPAGINTSMNCLDDAIPSTGCFACGSNGSGNVLQCESGGGWNLTPYTCTP